MLKFWVKMVALLSPQCAAAAKFKSLRSLEIDRLDPLSVIVVLLSDTFGCPDQFRQHPACLTSCSHGTHRQDNLDTEGGQKQVLACRSTGKVGIEARRENVRVGYGGQHGVALLFNGEGWLHATQQSG